MTDFTKLLSGDQLVERGCKHDQILPTKGPKSSVSNGSWIERKQIEKALDDRKHVLSHQRVEKLGTLTIAIWDEQKQKACVTEKRGTHWLHIGHTEDCRTYIYPEEVLHLLEMNALDLRFGGIRISLQQAYSKFIGKLISLEEYRVYSSLSRQGYKLLRHNPSIAYTESSEESDDDTDNSHLIENISKSMKNINNPEKTNIKAKVDCVILNESSSDESIVLNEDIQTQKDTTVIEDDSDASSVGTDVVCIPSFSLKQKILSKIPNCYRKDYLFLTPPETKYIPQGIVTSNQYYVLMLDKFFDKNNKCEENDLNRRNLPIENFQFVRCDISANNNPFFNRIMQNLLLQSNKVVNDRCENKISNLSTSHMKKHKSSQTVPTELKQEKDKETERSTTSQDIERVPSDVLSKKQTILKCIHGLLDRFSSMNVGNKSSEIKEALILAIIKLNDTFDERYTVVFKQNSCTLEQMPSDDESAHSDTNVLELSSGSESPPSKICRIADISSLNNSPFSKKRTERKRKSVGKCTSISLNKLPSDDSSEEFTAVGILRHGVGTSDIISRWFTENSWNTPELGNRNKRDNFMSNVGSKIQMAVLDNIKNLSHKKECPIESWSQGKQLYKNKIISNVVCISDDEMESENNDSNTMISPLIRQEDCISTQSVMKRLQIFKSNLNCKKYENVIFKVSFDMYLPSNKKLRKSNLPPPPFSIIVLSDDSAIPTSTELMEIRRSLHRSVLFLLAIVSFDTISYIQIDNIALPDLVRSSDNNT